MKNIPLSLTFITVFISSFYSLPSALASEHSHDNHHVTKQHNITLNNGEKWPIDTSLHTGMTRIKTSMEKHINAIHNKTFKAEQYSVLAKELQQHLNYLFSHCKLPSDADAQLHLLLFRVMQGVEKMQETSEQRTGAIKVIKALQAYPECFKDDNWQAISH